MAQPQRRNLWWPIVGAAVVCACLLAVYDGAGKMIDAENRLNQLNQLNHELDRQNQELLRQVQSLRNDPAAVVRAARREMDMVRPDEVVYQTGGEILRQSPTNEEAAGGKKP